MPEGMRVCGKGRWFTNMRFDFRASKMHNDSTLFGDVTHIRKRSLYNIAATMKSDA